MRDKDVSRVESWSNRVGSKDVRRPAVSQAADRKHQGAASARELVGDHGTGLGSRKKPSPCGKGGGTLRTAESEAHEKASRALIGVDPDPYLNGATSPVHSSPVHCSRLARVDSASLMPIIPGLEDCIGNYLGWLSLSDFPRGNGTALRIAGYEFPLHYIHVRPSTPGGIRPHVAIDISSLDAPIELLEGKTVEYA